MRIRETDPAVQWNWIAVLSYVACVAVSTAIWSGVIRGVQYLVR